MLFVALEALLILPLVHLALSLMIYICQPKSIHVSTQGKKKSFIHQVFHKVLVQPSESLGHVPTVKVHFHSGYDSNKVKRKRTLITY